MFRRIESSVLNEFFELNLCRLRINFVGRILVPHIFSGDITCGPGRLEIETSRYAIDVHNLSGKKQARMYFALHGVDIDFL
jgi:hypothetical protein